MPASLRLAALGTLFGATVASTLPAQVTTLQSSLGSSRAHSQASTLLRTWFAANDGVHGMELWSCDWLGMPRMERNLEPDGFEPKSSFPSWITVLGDPIVGGPVAFAATTQAEGREVRILDGATLRTIAIRPGAASASPTELTALGSGLAFSAITDVPTSGTRRLHWSADLTTAQSVGAVSGLHSPYGLRRFGGKLVFVATHSTGTELHTWTPGGPDPAPLRGHNGATLYLDPTPPVTTFLGVFFTARETPSAARQVYHWDGSNDPAAVRLPSGNYTDPDMLTPVGIGEVVFRARVAGNGSQIFRGNGDRAVQASQFAASVGETLGNLTVSGFDAWFTGDDGAGHELFQVGSTTTTAVAPLRPGGGAQPRHVVATPDGAWFSALRAGSDDRELWFVDRGSLAVTTYDLRLGAKSSAPTQAFSGLGPASMVADQANGRELVLLLPQGPLQVPINQEPTSDISAHIEPDLGDFFELTVETDPGAFLLVNAIAGPTTIVPLGPLGLSGSVFGLPVTFPFQALGLGVANGSGIFKAVFLGPPPSPACGDPKVLTVQAGSTLTGSVPFKLSDPATFVSGCATSGSARVNSTGSYDDKSGEYVIRSSRTDSTPDVHWLTLARLDRDNDEYQLLESRQIGPGETMVWTGEIDLDLPISAKDPPGDRLYLFFTDHPPAQSLLQQLTNLAVAWFSYC